MAHPILAMVLGLAGSMGLLTAWYAHLVSPITAAVGFAALLLVMAPLLLFSGTD